MESIKRFRKAKGWLQKDLAEMLGVAKNTVSTWESGERKPDIVTLKRLAEIFGCTADELLEPIQV
ncbi:MAG: helix-turn-helix transcriptional regulator [Ruminococcus sp.]|nr:helix-turn-helix transcriptional regulator [Ruminococcus sp.]